LIAQSGLLSSWVDWIVTDHPKSQLDSQFIFFSGHQNFVFEIFSVDENGTEGILDIPPEFRSLKAYCATLAHKTNHSFDPVSLS
jgi:hypothetical protein